MVPEEVWNYLKKIYGVDKAAPEGLSAMQNPGCASWSTSK